MGYFIRILGKQNPDIKLSELEKIFELKNVKITFDTENKENWTQLILKDNKNRDFLVVEKSEVIAGQLAYEELEEFREDIEDCNPKSAVKWLLKFFDKVKVIYTFQILNNMYEDDNWDSFEIIKENIWNHTKGIMQADNEGFSNEDGYHILWQFSDDVSGEWNMAVRTFLGSWKKF